MPRMTRIVMIMVNQSITPKPAIAGSVALRVGRRAQLFRLNPCSVRVRCPHALVSLCVLGCGDLGRAGIPNCSPGPLRPVPLAEPGAQQKPAEGRRRNYAAAR